MSRITIQLATMGTDHALARRCHARKAQIAGAECTQAWTYATHHDNDVQPRNREVDRAVAELHAARARAEATEANRDGRLDRARHVLEATARRVNSYAGNDAALLSLARSLRDDIPQYAEYEMTGLALKSAFFAAEVLTKGRDSYGGARRNS
jgi:hypothetical protein